MAHKLIDFPIRRERSLEDESLIRVNRIRMKVNRMKRIQEGLSRQNGS